jgi:hypothetical protein
MKRITTLAVGIVLVLAMMAAPASAHVLVVQDGEVQTHRAERFGGFAWVGGDGMGHHTGLNVACETLRLHDKSAVDMWGPPHQGTCPHGGEPPAS